jgi:hypothetical protein
MDGRNNIANDLFFKIRSRFTGLKLGEESGSITINPEEARFFDFDYRDEGNSIGHVTISLAEPNSMKVYFSSGITESMNENQKDKWYRFLRELRTFAKRRLMAFDTRDISKDNLDKRDFQYLTAANAPTPAKDTIIKSVGESVMNESQLYGTKTMSFQKLMDTRLIIKHSQAVMDDTQPGARSRNISALFVENQDGERFKYPFIHLAGARAMQRHVANGGLPYDPVGKSIIGMSEQIAQLRSFSNYVVRNDLMNSDTNQIIETSQQALERLRETVAKLAKQSHYEAYKESFQEQQPVDIPDSVIEDYKDKFTIRNFKEDIKSVFPVLYKLMQENNTVDYDDIVELTAETEKEIDEAQEGINAQDEFDKFEKWVSQLGETSAIQSDEDQLVAIESLNKLIASTFPAGVDGNNAIESLKGIIDDPLLYKEIKDAAKANPQEDVRPMIKAWVDENAKEIAAELDFGDMEQAAEEPAAEEPAAEEPAAEEPAGDAAVAAAGDEMVTQSDDPDERNKKDDEDDLPFDADDDASDKDEFGNTIKHRARHLARKGMRQAMDIKEVAEFINSFYDRESGTFPKGPEGVCTMVGKKFGEEAEAVARKFVERMAPHQEQGAEALAELGRMRELAGLQSEESQVSRPDTEEKSEESVAPELEDIRRLSGIAQGLGY